MRSRILCSKSCASRRNREIEKGFLIIEREFWLLILARFFEIENSRQCQVLLLTHESNYAGIVLGILRVEFGVVQRPENLVIIANWKNIDPPQILCGWFHYCLDDFNIVAILILFRQF